MFCERPLMSDELVRVQFKTVRHRTIEEIGDDVLNSVRCLAPALVADSDAAEHEYRLFRIFEVGPGVSGLVQVEEMHGEAPGDAFIAQGRLDGPSRRGSRRRHQVTSTPRWRVA